MKQHITIDDLNQLSEKGKEKYINTFWFTHNGEPIDFVEDGRTGKRYTKSNLPVEDYPLLSIGQMIEFLDENIGKRKIILSTGLTFSNDEIVWFPRKEKWVVGYGLEDERVEESKTKYYKDELCSALWEAVKEVLEQ